MKKFYKNIVSIVITAAMSLNTTGVIRRKIKKIKQKMNNLIDLRTDGDITISDFRERKKILESELQECEEELRQGLFGKENLKTINSVRKPFHRDTLERGEEVKVSLVELMKK